MALQLALEVGRLVYSNSPFFAAEQVLDHFQDQFITDVDASAIVTELEENTIISYSDRMMIIRTPNRIQQNQILYKCLRRRCTKEALMAVCEVIIAVQSNPQMKDLGEGMKKMLLERKCCVCSCVCVFICMHDFQVATKPEMSSVSLTRSFCSQLWLCKTFWK